jgi:hypothetical protein
MAVAAFLICIGVIFLVFSVLAAIAEALDRRDDREILRRFRENQRALRK